MSEISTIAATDANDPTPASGLVFGSPLTKGKVSGGTGDATVSFGDFVDMINPLQHVPVISALYRDATGDEISPMARIAGDTLYGGLMGPLSAGISAVVAMADEAFSENNGGDGMATTAVAGLFGSGQGASGDSAKVQLAEATSATTATDTAAEAADASDTTNKIAQTEAQTAAALKLAAQTSAAGVGMTPQAAGLKILSEQKPLLEAQGLTNGASQPATTKLAGMIETAKLGGDATSVGTGMPLDRSKMAYGGVMDTGMMQNAMQNQSLALALANGQNKMRDQHAMRNARLAAPVAVQQAAQAADAAQAATVQSAATTTATTPTAAATASASQPVSASSSATTASLSANGSDPIPQSLIDDLRALRGVNQYRSTAQQSYPSDGSGYGSLN